MPLPLAHGLLGASVVAAVRPYGSRRVNYRMLLVGAALGICPDFDYLLNWIPGLGGGWHHGFTHSFAFALALGWITAAVLGKTNARTVAAFALATFSHPLIDFLITESRGIELLWPLTSQRFRLMLPNPIDYSWRHPSVWDIVLDLCVISLHELLLFAPLLLTALLFRRFIDQRTASV